MSTVVVNQSNTTLVLSTQSTPVIVDKRLTGTVRINTPGPRGPRGEDGQPGADAAGQLPPRAFGWGDAPQVVFTAPADGVLTIVRLQMTEAFNGTGASIAVGTPGDPNAALPAAFNSPYSTFEFENSPDLALDEGDTVVLTVTPGTASAGAGLLFLSFLPTT